MDSEDDLQMQILLSHEIKYYIEINKALEQTDEYKQRLHNFDSYNTTLSMKVMAAFNDVKKKEAEIRNLNIEGDTLCAKQTHIDQCIRSKRTDIENLEKIEQHLINITNEVHRDFDEQVSVYEAKLEAIASDCRMFGQFNNEDFITTAIEKGNTEIQNLQQKVKEADEEINSLEEKLKNMKECVPEDILNIVGKETLQKQLESVTSNLKRLQEIYDKMVAEETQTNL